MTDLYGDFDDSDEGNDEDIGALGSILSWDDEDEVAVAAMVATASAEERDTLSSLPTLPRYGSYPQQISIVPNQVPVTTQQPFQMMMGYNGHPTHTQDINAIQLQQNNPSIHQVPVQQAPAQQVSATAQQVQQQTQPAIQHVSQSQPQTTHQPAQQQLQHMSISSNQEQQITQQIQPQPQAFVANSSMQQQHMLPNNTQQCNPSAQTQPQQLRPNHTTVKQMQDQTQSQIQQPQPNQLQSTIQGQQKLPQQHQLPRQHQTVTTVRPMIPAASQPTQTYTTLYQQPMFPNPNDQLQLQPTMTLVSGQPQQAQDPNVFLRQMQLQYQQVPGPRSLQHASPMMVQPQTMMAPAPTPIQGVSQTKRASSKRKVTDVKPPAAPKSNVVSCSDTDGETRGMIEPGKKAKKMPGMSIGKKTKAEHDIDMANMTPAEKAKANRDRNREHARNTRLRKKAYLEKLKTTVDELCRERDTLVSERAGAANLMVEMHNTRTEVLMSFFALRSSYERQRELWSSILDECCFASVMPVTPYRSFPASEVQVSKCQRTVLGIDGIMADTASLHVLLNTLIDRSKNPSAMIQFRYTLVTEDAVVAGNQMMARWVMSTLNATQLGARMEVAKQGMLCCKFNSAHKIIGLELMFDVMAFMLQLKQAAGSHEFTVVPNTVQTCQRPFKLPMVMTLAERPYTIVQVNKLWEDMTGFKAENVVGKVSCSILQGQETNRITLEQVMSEVRFKRPASVMLLNYTQERKLFRNYINLYPLSADSKITHYVALTAYSEQFDNISVNSIPDTQKSPLSQTCFETNSSIVKLESSIPQGVKPPTQLMIQNPSVIPTGTLSGSGADRESRQMIYYQAQQGILPKPNVSASLPLIQPISNVPTAIAPRTAKANIREVASQSQPKNRA